MKEKNTSLINNEVDVNKQPNNEPEEKKQIEPIKKVKKCKGLVSECSKLRIRYGASVKSKEIGCIEKNSIVKINIEDSTDSFYSVEFNGIKGFCMKQYITII